MRASSTLRATERLAAPPEEAFLREACQAPTSGFVHLEAAQEIYPVLVELGADPGALVAEAALDPHLFDGDGEGTFVSFTALGRLMALAAAHTRCPHLGLLVGQRTALSALGLLGVLLRHSQTVGDALHALEAHLSVRDQGAVFGLGVHDDIAVLSYAPYEPEADGAALHSERALAQAINILRALCGPDWAPTEVLLPRSTPAQAEPYGAFFRAPVRFDQEMAALVLPAVLLQRPIAGADPGLRRKAEERVHWLEALESSTLTDELRRYLRTAVTRQRCRAARVARLRLVHRRTLSRRLKAEGTSFRQLAGEAQFRVARQLLADTGMSMAQIAAVLDFSEPSAFTHAFRRWSGMTPTAWRRLSRPQPTDEPDGAEPQPSATPAGRPERAQPRADEREVAAMAESRAAPAGNTLIARGIPLAGYRRDRDPARVLPPDRSHADPAPGA